MVCLHPNLELYQWQYRPVMWSVVPEDWVRPGVSVVVQRVLQQVQNGSLIVLHDGACGGQDVQQQPSWFPNCYNKVINLQRSILYGGMDLYKPLIYSYPSCQSPPEFTTMASGRSPEFVKLNRLKLN